ncbi:hypothetical protein CK203_066890 [Vitis vinifera]|uniref:Uncharacterized protein n=1 Tax=Vitis vinifera TaxID=29760 RepID=A0A438F5I0_VITVI|nr:hypothetical protein CK203_066890 [Vitis vinifera]
MAKIRFIHAYSLLLAVITYHHILYTEARPIKSPSSIDYEPGKETGSQGTEHKDVWSGPPPPEPNPIVKYSVAGKEEILPPMIPITALVLGIQRQSTQMDFDLQLLAAAPVLAIPLHQPKKILNLRHQAIVPRHSVKANKDDYRPTVLGHRPGVGHSLQKTNAEPNA